MATINQRVTDSVIRRIMEGADPRSAIDSVLDEKAGYHKEKRIRDGKATVVNVKNKKRKVHHTLTAAQKKAIKKAHTAQANKKRTKSLKKGAKMGLYQGREFSRFINPMAEADNDENEVVTLGIVCPNDGTSLEYFTDTETGEVDSSLFVCPECGETFVLVSTSELEEGDDDDTDDSDDADEKDDDVESEETDSDEEGPVDEAAEMPEDCEDDCDSNNTGLYFEA